ncbi:hypothetical protein IFM89_027818 [Coptis chinensis]|uniref:Methyltransferase type 11 domain-containing protein n=1 Tax=Coptis chinensis TaxID=261450 RepID=A0A835IY57_9MAGN|nr:hypothetical protein IFM89_027818 [Coptis chinensis]
MKIDCVGCFDLVNGTEKYRFVKAKKKNVTVVTSTLNVDAPFNEFIAARGLFPMFFSLHQRFPFYDNMFDLVHDVDTLGEGGRQEKMEFLMFDIDQVLRAGGLFSLDNFHCVDEEKKMTQTRVIERFGYKKLKWLVGEKIVSSGKYQRAAYKNRVGTDARGFQNRGNYAMRRDFGIDRGNNTVINDQGEPSIPNDTGTSPVSGDGYSEGIQVEDAQQDTEEVENNREQVDAYNGTNIAESSGSRFAILHDMDIMESGNEIGDRLKTGSEMIVFQDQFVVDEPIQMGIP